MCQGKPDKTTREQNHTYYEEINKKLKDGDKTYLGEICQLTILRRNLHKKYACSEARLGHAFSPGIWHKDLQLH